MRHSEIIALALAWTICQREVCLGSQVTRYVCIAETGRWTSGRTTGSLASVPMQLAFGKMRLALEKMRTKLWLLFCQPSLNELTTKRVNGFFCAGSIRHNEHGKVLFR